MFHLISTSNKLNESYLKEHLKISKNKKNNNFKFSNFNNRIFINKYTRKNFQRYSIII